MSVFGTGELAKRLSQEMGYTVSRTVLFRLREQYADRLPEPGRVGNNFGWTPDAVEAFKVILREEASAGVFA
jgi:hypothetical protein